MNRFLGVVGAALLLAIPLILLLQRSFPVVAERYQHLARPSSPLRGTLMFLLPLPVLLAALGSLVHGDLNGLFANGVGYSMFLGGALWLRRGLRSEADYSRRQVAKTPWPFKALGSGLIALATGTVAWASAGHSPLMSAIFGSLALLGCYLTYGFDPRTAKRFTDRDGIDSTDRVLQALTQAERSIAAIEQAIRNINDAEINGRLRRIVGQARQILTMLEEDPRDLRRARKFLNVYLDGTKQVTEGYAKTHGRTPTPELENNFRQVLATIEQVFGEQRQKLLEADVTDLDVQIEVLNNQLKREGVV
ncbi:MAG: 5-bromo-4-chloroindolyl phosphate hydrolysis family protein [Candidatus Competibacter sp.]|nr:5-bromo-4-chloroindolyl phosphate hydrolysis family protein [Candidatus Competibacter sp.]